MKPEGKWLPAIAPTAIKDNASWTSIAIDTQGFSYAELVFQMGATDVDMVALKVQESDSFGSGYADISGADMSVSPAQLPQDDEDNGLFGFRVDLRQNRKRYLKLIATAGDGSTGSYGVGIARLSQGEITPHNASTRGFVRFLEV